MSNRDTDEPEIIPYYDNNLGGVRPGAGRKKGQVNEETKLKRAAEKKFKIRAAKLSHKLFNAQLSLALGEQSLYVKRKKGDKTITERIEDEDTIVQYLNGELDDDDNEYYYLSKKSPDNKALDSILDRTFGKARQAMDIDLTSDDEPINITPVSVTILKDFKQYMLESTKNGNQS